MADAPVIWAQGLTKRYGDNFAPVAAGLYRRHAVG
jgi:hypothetical protein